MAGKQLSFFLTCAATWCVLIPALLMFGGLFLLCYALLAEIRDRLLGTRDAVDMRDARRIAQRMCMGS